MEHRFFHLLPERTHIPFVKLSKFTFWFSLPLMLAILGLLLTKGLNYGVDFKGGTLIHVGFSQATSANDVRQVLQPAGFGEVSVQDFGEEGKFDYLIRVPPVDIDMQNFKGKFEGALNPLGVAYALRFAQERAYVRFEKEVLEATVKKAMEQLNVKELALESVTPFGSMDNHEFLAQFSGMGAQVINVLHKGFPSGSFEVLQIEQVGAKVGKDLRTNAVFAVLISIVFIFIYVAFRFDAIFAPGAILALVHDALFVLGLFSLLSLQFDLSIVAAVLTLIGFSINDTIVVFDRVRENLGLLKNMSFETMIDRSLNETLSRTVLTSGTLFLAAMALWLYGGPITENFAISFTVGVVAGTYSTLFVATPLTVYLYNYRQKRNARR